MWPISFHAEAGLGNKIETIATRSTIVAILLVRIEKNEIMIELPPGRNSEILNR